MKIIITLLAVLTLIIPTNVFAEEKEDITLSTCVDSVSARFILNKEEIKVRFIGIEAGEFINSSSFDEINGKTVDDYVCSILTNAKKIQIEYEPNISRIDKYGRINAWIFVDDELIESHLVSLGYAKVAYLYDDYKYNDALIEDEKKAKEEKRGIWQSKEEPKKEEEVVEEPIEEEQNDGLLDSIGKFFKGIFDAIVKFFNDIVEDILE